MYKDTDCLSHRRYGPLRIFFWASWGSEGLLGQSFSGASSIQALRGLPFLGFSSVVWCIRHMEGPLWLGPSSVDWHIRPLKGHPGWGPTLYFGASGICLASLSIIQLPMLACGEREALVVAPSLMCDSTVSPCFHGCLAFHQRHFPPQSPPSHPLHRSLHSQQQPSTGDCHTIPKLQLPATAPSMGPMSLPGIHMAVARTI